MRGGRRTERVFTNTNESFEDMSEWTGGGEEENSHDHARPDITVMVCLFVSLLNV